VRRARQALESADIVLLVIDVSNDADSEQDLRKELPAGVTTIVVGNKTDLLSDKSFRLIQEQDDAQYVWISTKTGQGMDVLRSRIRGAVGATDQVEGSFSARQRHIDALKRAGSHLEAGGLAMETSQAGELLAEELRLAQQALGEITGEMLPDDLLGEIFSSFCIGK
jgi:tRNA modification GTPase